jgi:hypothetical protein
MDLPQTDGRLGMVGIVGDPGELVVVETGELDAGLVGGGSSQPDVSDEGD